MRTRTPAIPTGRFRLSCRLPPADASDVITRILLSRMATSLGQNFVVENRPGAGGNTGTAAVAHAAPDGYTLVMSTSGPLAANKALFRELGYDPQKDFSPICLFATLPNVVVINAKLPPKTLLELIEYAKAHPRQLNYGSVGVGSSQHLAGAYFEQLTGTQLVHVPYRNIASYTPDFISGQVPVGFQLLPNVLGLIQNGDARALAVAGNKRMTALPDVPTAAEAGLQGYESYAWLALLGPANMDQVVIDRLSTAAREATQDPKLLCTVRRARRRTDGGSVRKTSKDSWRRKFKNGPRLSEKWGWLRCSRNCLRRTGRAMTAIGPVADIWPTDASRDFDYRHSPLGAY